MIADQALRSEVLDITKSFLVQAPAGSGKTSLLVQRFLALLTAVESEPEEILAITFTRKAAAQMRSRIIEALQLGLQQDEPQDPYQNTLWTLARQVLKRDQQLGWDLIYNPARLKIQTIDALCTSITKQMPIITRFGAQPQIEQNPGFLYEKAVDQLLQDLNTNTPWKLALTTLLQHLYNDRSKIKKLFVRMLEIRDQWLHSLIANARDENFKTILQNSLNVAIEEALGSLQTSVPKFFVAENFVDRLPDSLEEYLELANILLTLDGEWRQRLTEREGFYSPSKASNKNEQQALKARKDAALAMLDKLATADEFRRNLAGLRKLPPREYTDAQWNIIDAMITVLPVLVANLLLVFKDSGTVDFCEVSLAALNALTANGAASDLALRLDDKFNHILVDEFQDTSIVQYRLLEQLTINWSGFDGRSLFLVGDPMQSIYRFRQAQVGLFLKAKQHGIGRVKLNFIQLTVNFRSNTDIISWYNRVFSASFPEIDDMTLGAISYMPAQAAVTEVSANPVTCYAVDSENEAQQIIRIIKEIRSSKEFKSIAILVNAKTHLEEILPALRQANIEYQGVDLEKLSKRPVILDLLMLTRALLHLDDRIAWLAILRAPWCGVSLTELSSLSQTDQTIWQSLQQANLPQLRIERFKLVIADALDQMGRQSINNIVKNTWHNLGGAYCVKDANDLQAVESFFSLLTDLAAQRELFTPEFLQQRLEDLFLQSTVVNRNAVQIMTMHKAKGLEFDVVILPGIDKITRGNDQQMLLVEHRDFMHDYLLLAPIKASDQQSDQVYDYLAWCEQQRQQLESLRVLYVAITRARQQIFCLANVAAKPPANNSLLAKIWPVVATQFVTVDLPLQISASGLKTLSRLPERWYQSNPYTPQPITNLTNRELLVWQPDWVRLAGIVLHRAFWQAVVNNNNLPQPQVWRQHLRQLGVQQRYLDAALDLIGQGFDNAYADQVGSKILATDYQESYAEWRLTAVKSGVTKNLVIDRAFLDHDGTFWIVDYKLVNNEADVPSAIEKYSSQVFEYFSLVKKLKNNVPIKAGLYFALQKRWHVLI